MQFLREVRAPTSKMSQLEVFPNYTNELENYYRRFERFVINSMFKETVWAAYWSDLFVDGHGASCSLDTIR